MLASASPRRLALLAQIGIVPDHVIDTAVDETRIAGEEVRRTASRLARDKAQAGFVRAGRSDALVLAADTIVALGGGVQLGKPADQGEARRMLSRLSGRRHRVVTAVVLRGPDGRVTERVVTSVVAFARLDPDRLEALVALEEWRGKAGGYAIQGRSAASIRFLSGSHSNVIGLPLFETAQLLRGHGLSV